MKACVETGDLRHARQSLGHGIDCGEVVRLMEWRKRHEGAEVRQHFRRDNRRTSVLGAPVDDAMTDAEQLDYLLELARKGDYLPPDAGHEQIRTALDLWIANLRLLWRYRPTPLAGRLVMIRAGDEPDEDLYAGWERLAGNGLERHVVAGNHYTIMREPRIADVTAIVNGLLAEGRNGTGRVQHPHA